MPQNCALCEKNAVTFIRYSGQHLCFSHLSDFVTKRAKRSFREQYPIPQNTKIAVAVSGGKDSIAALHITQRLFGEHRDKSVFAVTVDEGINGYRSDSIEVTRQTCRSMGLEHVVVSFNELYGMTLDEMLSHNRTLGACSYCGVLRRKAMNHAALRWEAAVLVMGLNLDDVTQGILMNFVGGDVERLARMGPHRKVQPGLVPRVLPLRTVPEKESYMYCLANGLEFHEGQCPYANEAQRGLYRDLLNSLEDRNPGTRHSILKSHDEILPLLQTRYPSAELLSCEACGDPTINKKCQACLMIDELKC